MALLNMGNDHKQVPQKTLLQLVEGLSELWNVTNLCRHYSSWEHCSTYFSNSLSTCRVFLFNFGIQEQISLLSGTIHQSTLMQFVLIPAKAKILDFSETPDSGKMLVQCVVSGEPSPKITWSLGNVTIPSGRYPQYPVTSDNKLSIPTGSLQNNTFVCNASNRHASESRLAKGERARQFDAVMQHQR